ncbi:hypothetical protein SKAU_G00143360 [Synaphobranchus kaupii]|uniref:Uncharacterized protein n=1 Tax=Synaphobranchus kaupii TaxID=118154 RepID=A0A9Q1FTL9_SYNKA|nr:hypothetical protein SKAU_G00143360 [Synaphobranchus kaupii]
MAPRCGASGPRTTLDAPSKGRPLLWKLKADAGASARPSGRSRDETERNAPPRRAAPLGRVSTCAHSRESDPVTSLISGKLRRRPERLSSSDTVTSQVHRRPEGSAGPATVKPLGLIIFSPHSPSTADTTPLATAPPVLIRADQYGGHYRDGNCYTFCRYYRRVPLTSRSPPPLFSPPISQRAAEADPSARESVLGGRRRPGPAYTRAG